MTEQATQQAKRTIPCKLDNVIVRFNDGNQVVARRLRAMKSMKKPCIKYQKKAGGWAKRRSRVFGVSADGKGIMIGYFHFRQKRWVRWWIESELCLFSPDES